MRPILVIVGPTASGKSGLAVELARELDGEVISADSRQVYRGLTIGTGKISEEEMLGVPHHMLDVADPQQVFTAHDYAHAALPILETLLAEDKLPIICGGTGFYIDVLLGRVSLPDVPVHPEFREKIKDKTTDELYALLLERDPARAETIDRHNPVRLVRALEIADALGSVPLQSPSPVGHDQIWIGINPPQAVLHERIRSRLRSRLEAGMIDEARSLHRAGLTYARMVDLGLEYRHLAQLLEGHVTEADMEENLARDIMHYAKRQLTYWRRNTDIHWIAEPDVTQALEKLAH